MEAAERGGRQGEGSPLRLKPEGGRSSDRCGRHRGHRGHSGRKDDNGGDRDGDHGGLGWKWEAAAGPEA